MPLTRTPSGALSVMATGGNGTVLVINELRLYIGNEEFTGHIKAVADGHIVERNRWGINPIIRVYSRQGHAYVSKR